MDLSSETNMQTNTQRGLLNQNTGFIGGINYRRKGWCDQVAQETAGEVGGQRAAHQTVVVVLLGKVQPEFHEGLASGLKRAAREDVSHAGQ